MEQPGCNSQRISAVGPDDKPVRLVQRDLADPSIISVLEKDSCDVASGAYCVIIVDAGRKIAVNRFDKGVVRSDMAHPRQGAVPISRRPHMPPSGRSGQNAPPDHA